MALSDLVLKAKVNMALARDPRVGVLDIGVTANNGIITLTGDVDDPQQCEVAAQIAQSVPGVQGVQNELTCGIGQTEDTAEMVKERFLAKLDEEWEALPDRTALTQADYLRWALWLIYKFHIPASLHVEDVEALEAEATEEALEKVSGHVGVPKALLALEMLRQAEDVAESPYSDVPEPETTTLATSPLS
ncbi:MAG TPA: BON domain-containing protein [Chthonomonadaceae bacterium]|nr:BON domain-containing protein [Chthonomonadaceae bacterium]